MTRTEPKFQRQRLDQLPSDLLVKGGWVSTAMALILSLPSLGLFVSLYEVVEMNIGAAAGIGFGIHFILLALSRKVSIAVGSFFD